MPPAGLIRRHRAVCSDCRLFDRLDADIFRDVADAKVSGAARARLVLPGPAHHEILLNLQARLL
jgi:hypothetical protein